jgi:hypothetical protein
VDSLDVARGAAMSFVCLSHFAAAYLSTEINPSLPPSMQRVGAIAGTVSMIASPSFIAVSGIVVAYLYRTNPGGMSALRRKLIDRGLFLLVVGHVLLALPSYIRMHSLAPFRFEMITYAIAVLIIVGPSLVVWTSPKARLALGTSLLILSWIASYLLVPHNTLGLFITGYAFGVPNDPTVLGFPFVPWLGVYLLATVLGERLGADARSESSRAHNLLLHVGGAAMGGGAAITIARHVVRALAPTIEHYHSVLFGFLAAGQKFPPGPVYLMLFGGAGLILVSKAFTIARDGACPVLTRPLSAIGRASFFVFILQGYVYYLALPAIDPPHPALWPVYYVISLLVFLAAAMTWNSFDGNRYLTIGLWRTVPIVKAVHARVRTAFAAR